MLSREDYIRRSLETNLFFLRLAKEHAILGAASLPPRDIHVSCQLIDLKNKTEMLLANAVMLSQGVLSPEVLSSRELVTELTLQAEAKTQFLTGIPIDMNITRAELALRPGSPVIQNPMLLEQVSMLNMQAISDLNIAGAFLQQLHESISRCNTFSYVYPHMLEHIIDETRFYTMLLMKLQDMEDIDSLRESIIEELKLNWNEIMGDHAEFIRGYLDPAEKALFKAADTFAKEFDRLSGDAPMISPRPLPPPELLGESLKAAADISNFKMQGTEGILACKVKSLISPLLGDHVLREANRYLRLLKSLGTEV